MVVPLMVLMFVSINRASLAAADDFDRRLEYAFRLFEETLRRELDRLQIRTKTVADFDLYPAALNEFETSQTVPILQYEMIRSGLDFIAIIENRSSIKLEQGAKPPEHHLAKIIAELTFSPLITNIYLIDNSIWIFSVAQITKAPFKEPYHLVFAKKLPVNYADSLKRLTNAEYSLIGDNKWLVTTVFDNFGARMTKQATQSPEAQRGKLSIANEAHSFKRSGVLQGYISAPLKLEIALPDSEYDQLTSVITRDFLIFGILGLILAMITGTTLAWHIAYPLNELAKNTSQIAHGEFVKPTLIKRSDEIGTLYQNFDNMVNSLYKEQKLKERKMKELNTLFEISNAVNLFKNSQDLLKIVLSHCIDVLDAERGSIMLLDDETDDLVVKVATGGRYRIMSANPIKPGAGICGGVVKNGVGQICNEGFKDPSFKNFGSLMPVEDIRTLICSPLKFKDGTIGVINIVNKREDKKFDNSDLSLLNLIATQAAVTIENNKLYELSITDGLTQLFVHRYFQAKLSEEILRARRYNLSLSLIMIDIDNFKLFNDKYGHQTGDMVLQKVTAIIKDIIRFQVDVPCRYGGEELAVILPETKIAEASQTAERIRQSIAGSTLKVSGFDDLKITVSLGISSYPTHAHDKNSLIESADKALYQSKNSGKNVCTVAGDISENA